MSDYIDKFHLRLTEVDRDEVVFVEQLLQHPPVDLLDLVADLEDVLRGRPLQNAILVVQVSVKPERNGLQIGFLEDVLHDFTHATGIFLRK